MILWSALLKYACYISVLVYSVPKTPLTSEEEAEIPVEWKEEQRKKKERRDMQGVDPQKKDKLQDILAGREADAVEVEGWRRRGRRGGGEDLIRLLN